MKDSNKLIGKYGEDIACDYYLENGYETLDRNFIINQKEVDLILRKDDLLIFVEVKARSNNLFGSPCESVSLQKQKNIKYVANYYLSLNNLNDVYVRYDVAEIFFNYYDDTYELNIIKDAFR